MKRALLGFVAAGALVTSPALAADLARPYYKAPPPPPPPAWSWTGCHVGADVGVAWMRDKDTETFTATGAASPFSPYPTNTATPDGAKVGGYLGCDYQFSSHFVIGAEGDAEWAGIRGGSAFFPGSGPPNDFYETRANFESSIRARIGYAFNRSLIYATGGPAWARITEHDVVGATGLSEDHSTTRGGWTVGGGLEYAFLNNLVGRVEYRYTDFGRFTYASTIFPAFTESHKITENALRFGISYKFGAGPYSTRY